MHQIGAPRSSVGVAGLAMSRPPHPRAAPAADFGHDAAWLDPGRLVPQGFDDLESIHSDGTEFGDVLSNGSMEGGGSGVKYQRRVEAEGEQPDAN
ncbi:hypothetical protein PVAP13_3KG205935 [Panicum virgatum]|uniref:Uncharacterized protein n=1 Tax=Panicum virgatum TaxID=38727 RepID=A0A8T0URL4_PANVG|nr:hypothetical protein PVAP13_3KG205935 [Panicum virgatum]